MAALTAGAAQRQKYSLMRRRRRRGSSLAQKPQFLSSLVSCLGSFAYVLDAMAGLLVCPLCGGRSQGFTSLQALLVSLLQAVSRPLACPVCPDSLAGLDKFTLHLLAHAVPLAQTGIVFSETPTFTPSPVILQTGQTPLIEFTPEEPRLTNVELSSASFTQVVVEKETSVQPKEEPVCPLCQLTLADPSLLPMHMQLVHRGESAEGRFACQLCPKSFKMRGTLIVHRKVAHPTTGEETTPDEGNGKDDKTSGTKKVRNQNKG